MQAKGLRSNQQAIFTTEATMLANDMANRIMAYTSPGGVYNGIEVTAAPGGCAGIVNNTVLDDCNDWIDAFNSPSQR